MIFALTQSLCFKYGLWNEEKNVLSKRNQDIGQLMGPGTLTYMFSNKYFRFLWQQRSSNIVLSANQDTAHNIHWLALKPTF
jgi:hypothetical protein